MISALGRLFDNLPTPVVWLVCVALTGLVYLGDERTGGDVAWSIFYLGPVVIAAWRLGWHAALLMVAATGLTWLLADFRTTPDSDYAASWIRYWNGLVRAGFFFIVAYTLTHLRRAIEHERELASTDGLTGLSNARSFYDLAARELSRAARGQRSLTIAYIDVDGFKGVNDTRGHMAGDDLLALIAKTLRSATRDVDVVGRLGGDEFAILLPDTDAAQARVAVARITGIVTDAVGGWPIGLSCGVITARGGDMSLEDLVQRADALMYEVKKSGGRSICYSEA